MLAGMERLIRECRPKIVLEFSPHHIKRLGDDPEDVSRYVRTLGYSVTCLGEHDEQYAIEKDWDCCLVLT